MEMNVQYILLALGPVFGLFIGLEFFYLRAQKQKWATPKLSSAQYSWTDTLSNGFLALMHEASDGICSVLFIMAIYGVLFEYRLFEIENSALSFLALFLLQDFFYYWFHRGSHKIRWMWASHVVHHSSQTLNLSTAMRQSFTYPISGMWLFWTPIVWLGYEPELVVAAVLLSLGYQFFVHTQLVGKLGVLEQFMNTPSHHRVHHAKNPEYIDQNYAGVLIIWDKMFGSFVEEREDTPCEYGITRQVKSHNPVYLTLHEWWDMFSDAFGKNKSLWHRLKHLWANPNWQPEHDHEKKTPLASNR